MNKILKTKQKQKQTNKKNKTKADSKFHTIPRFPADFPYSCEAYQNVHFTDEELVAQRLRYFLKGS